MKDGGHDRRARWAGKPAVVALALSSHLGLLAWPAFAGTGAVPPRGAELAERSAFLEDRLDAGRLAARAWQHGWTGLHAVTTASGIVGAVSADDADERVAGVVTALKSAAALGQLLARPLPARLGADPMRRASGSDPARLVPRVALGERHLLENASREAAERFNPRRHAAVVIVNLIGGAAILGFGDAADAAVSTLTGIAVGEAQIWSQPWRADRDLREYQERFPQERIGLELRPRPGGFELALVF